MRQFIFEKDFFFIFLFHLMYGFKVDMIYKNVYSKESVKRWYKKNKDTLMDIPSCSNSLSKNWMLYQNLLSQEFKLYRSIFIDQREDLTYNFLFQTFFFYVYCLFMRCILIKQHILRFSILGHFLLQVNVASSLAAMYLYNIYT